MQWTGRPSRRKAASTSEVCPGRLPLTLLVSPRAGNTWLQHTVDASQQSGITVPAHWHLEVVNRLGQQLRLGRLTPEGLRDDLRILAALDVDTRPFSLDPNEILGNMARYHLTAYDAAYLQLAIATGLPLATYDRALIAAALIAGVHLLS